MVSVLIDHNFAFEIFRQVEEHLFFAQIVREKKDAVLHVRLHDVDQPLVSFLTAWEIVLWIRKCVIKVKVVYIDSDCL